MDGEPLRLRALIVEQNAPTAQRVSSALQAQGYDVAICSDPDNADSEYFKHDYSLLLLVVDNNKISNWNLCRRIRAGSSSAMCLIGVVSGEVDDLASALAAGADDFLLLSNQDFDMRLLVVAQRAENRRNWQAVQGHLKASEARFALAAKAANDGIWDWDLQAETLVLSDRWKEMLGCSNNQLDDSPDEWLSRVHADDLADVRKDLDAHIQGDSPRFENEHRVLHADGTYRWMLNRAVVERSANGTALRLVGTQTDITVRKQAELQMLHNTLHDPLTNLPNRALILDRISCALERTRRSTDYEFAVLYLNLDRFKVVTDSLGHVVGDKLICGVAERLQTCMRTGDTVGRSVGDEFIVLVDDLDDPSDAVRVAKRIQQQLSEPHLIDGQEVFTTVSIGIALSNRGYSQPTAILRDADTALRRAKGSVVMKHAVFDSQMHDRAVARLELETDLRRAIEREEFRLHYQPLVDLDDNNRIMGFEALIRWQHPTRGLLSPAFFLDMAEETGLIVPIGYWVLREACSQLSVWHKQFPMSKPLSVNVNLSSKQFTDPALVQEMDNIIHESGVNPYCLWLEITESVIMENPQMAREMLTKLKERGLQICLDDFGTGHSSFAHLHKLPVDVLKIDRTFISEIGEQGENSEIVQVILTLAEYLGLDVVAEGIETESQARQLRDLKSGIGQGFFFSRPLTTTAVEDMWCKQPSRFGLSPLLN